MWFSIVFPLSVKLFSQNQKPAKPCKASSPKRGYVRKPLQPSRTFLSIFRTQFDQNNIDWSREVSRELFCGKFGPMPTFRSTRKRQEILFVTSLRLSDHRVLHNIASSSSFCSISLGFSRFFRSYFVLQNFWS